MVSAGYRNYLVGYMWVIVVIDEHSWTEGDAAAMVLLLCLIISFDINIDPTF